MVACKQCSTQNSLDSLFCKKCGEALAADERTEAQQKLQELISEGYRIFNEGRTDEARLVAEAALSDDPASSSALSLKGMCHERAGEIAEALAAFEKVVEINPDSALDRIKVTHLRQALTGKVLAEPPPRQGRALLGAAAAVLLVVAVGIAIGASSPQEPEKLAQRESPNLNTQTTAFEESTPPKNDVAAKPEVKSNVAEPTGSGVDSPTVPNSNGVIRRPSSPLPRYTGPLPDIEGAIPDGNKPITVSPPTGVRTVPDPSVPSTRIGSRDVDPVIETEDGSPKEDPKKPAFDPGVIDIKVSKPKPTLGGSQDLPDGNGVEALLKTARQQFLLGHYGPAASSYEAALRGGANPASTNQRLGQCYANLGNNNQAAAAFKKAIAAYESLPKSPSVQAALEASRRALKTVGG